MQIKKAEFSTLPFETLFELSYGHHGCSIPLAIIANPVVHYVENEGQIVGWGFVFRGLIELFVNEDFRRQGIGTELVRSFLGDGPLVIGTSFPFLGFVKKEFGIKKLHPNDFDSKIQNVIEQIPYANSIDLHRAFNDKFRSADNTEMRLAS